MLISRVCPQFRNSFRYGSNSFRSRKESALYVGKASFFDDEMDEFGHTPLRADSGPATAKALVATA